jgi:hypothetical protein
VALKVSNGVGGIRLPTQPSQGHHKSLTLGGMQGLRVREHVEEELRIPEGVPQDESCLFQENGRAAGSISTNFPVLTAPGFRRLIRQKSASGVQIPLRPDRSRSTYAWWGPGIRDAAAGRGA